LKEPPFHIFLESKKIWQQGCEKTAVKPLMKVGALFFLYAKNAFALERRIDNFTG